MKITMKRKVEKVRGWYRDRKLEITGRGPLEKYKSNSLFKRLQRRSYNTL
jgi:hypothetical protein